MLRDKSTNLLIRLMTVRPVFLAGVTAAAAIILLAIALTIIAMANRKEERVAYPKSVFPLRPVHRDLGQTSWLMSIGGGDNSIEIPELPMTKNAGQTSTVEFAISLKMRDQLGFNRKVGSGELLSQAQLEQDYLPLKEHYRAVLKWLKDNQVKIVSTNSSRLSVTAEAPVSTVESLFHVGMVNLSFNGTNYLTATNAPSLPKAISDSVSGVQGLQPSFKPEKHQAAPLGVNTSVQDRWLKDALGTYGVASVELTGKNQTIGILVDSLPNERDLRAFWSSNQIAYVADRVSMTNLALAGESLPTDATEATLDTEWATSVARESKVRVYATGFYSWIKIANALGKIFDETANNPTLHVLSLSFGAGEQDIPPDQVGELMNQLGLLTSKGITIFVSSGDEGDTPRRPYPNEDMRILQVEFPASSPFVTAVGGTSLSFDATTNIVEAGWKGSGGGISSKFRIPNWQKGVGIPQRNLNRLVPDVSLIADPEINIVYGTKVVHVGGTSVSTPIWAGIAALINEGRARNGFAPVGLLNSHIYGLIGNAAMTDIISGSNGSYVAAVGYDMVSGIGVPKVPELIALLSKTQ